MDGPAAPEDLSSGPPTPEPAAPASQPFGSSSPSAGPVPIPQKQTEWASGYQNEHGPRPSRWESWVSAPAQEAMHGSVASPWGGTLERLAQSQAAANGTILSPDAANKAFPGRPVPYTTPVDAGTAGMEYEDRRKQQDLADWVAQRPQTFMGRVVGTASGFVGGLTDPLVFGVGMASGGLSELMAPEGAGLANKVIAHYLANMGGFSAVDAAQNMIDHQMGAKQKQFWDVVGDNKVPAAIMTGVGVGLGALARRYLNEGAGTSEADIAAIKQTAAALEKDQRAPQLEDQRGVLQERKAGVSVDPAGEKIKPTVMTSPMQETQLYAASHSDGTPLTHEHGMGPGTQLTDSHDVANNGVSRSSETPGQIGETQLPPESKLLNIDQPGQSEPAFIKAVEEKTGIPIDVSQGDSLKDIITNLGDWAGADTGKGQTVPEDVLKQIQEVAKSQGYAGYEFKGENSRQAHVFDASGMQISKAYAADPATTPELPGPKDAETPTESPATERLGEQGFSPETEKLVHDFHKAHPMLDEYDPGATAKITAEAQEMQKQLAELAETSPTAKAALEALREHDAQDKRLANIAKRIADCGSP